MAKWKMESTDTGGGLGEWLSVLALTGGGLGEWLSVLALTGGGLGEWLSAGFGRLARKQDLPLSSSVTLGS